MGLGRGLGLAALSGLIVLLAPELAAAQNRVALVIGNGAYEHMSVLPNPPKDAMDTAAALGRLGFDVTQATDADRGAMLDALGSFRSRTANADIALVFFAGHGIEVNDTNYLIPVDAEQLPEEPDAARRQVEDQMVTLDDMLGYAAGARLQLAILDACRNDPIEGRARSVRRMSRGLAPVQVLEPDGGGDVMAWLSTAPGELADDGPRGTNSPFAAALLEHMAVPGVSLEELFRRVTDTVLSRTADVDPPQRPYASGSLRRAYYLAGSADGVVGSSVPTAQALYELPSDGDRAPTGLKYRILAPGFRDQPVEVDPNTTFRSGDSIKLAIEQNTDGYLYMAQHGSDGRWEWLIPGWAGAVEFSPGGRERVIPQGFWIEFDETAGTERVFLYLSRERDDSILDFRRGADGSVEAQPIGQRTVNDLTSGIGSMNLKKGRADATVAPGAMPAGQSVFVVNPDGGRVWTMIELRHE